MASLVLRQRPLRILPKIPPATANSTRTSLSRPVLPAASRTMLSSTSTPATAAIDWNASNYLRFADERTRPARDLLAAIPPLPSPSSPRIIDLGCGPANSTALLAARYDPTAGARLTGIDSSPNMLEQARKALPSARFEVGDLRTWNPPSSASSPPAGSGADDDGAPVDLLFSNAAIHWLPDPDILPTLARWAAALPRGAVFAMQVPDNVREPSHVLMGETAIKLGLLDEEGVAVCARKPFPEPRALVETLEGVCDRVDVWQTVYWHRLKEGHAGIVAWFRESGLRPFLERVGGERERAELEKGYEEALRGAYPPLGDGSVLLRFPRLFLVAVRK